MFKKTLLSIVVGVMLLTTSGIAAADCIRVIELRRDYYRSHRRADYCRDYGRADYCRGYGRDYYRADGRQRYHHRPRRRERIPTYDGGWIRLFFSFGD